MVKIVIERDKAEQIRHAQGRIELVDYQGRPVGVVRKPPTDEDVEEALGRIGREGPKYTVDQVIERIESL